MREALGAAGGALLIAVMNEMRARSAARAARLERAEALAEIKYDTKRTRRAVENSGE